MLALRPAEVHLSLVFCREIRDPALLERYRELLSQDELEQGQRFHHADDRHRYLLTRALLRTTLSRYAPRAPHEWNFTRDAFGRPLVIDSYPPCAAVVFNLSHTRELILLGVTRDPALGVDVEAIAASCAGLPLAERYFSRAEIAGLRVLSPERQVRRFFDLWTLKESYIKALGRGLSIPLRDFEFDIELNRVTLRAEPRVDREPQRWHFSLFQPRADHIAAVCTQRPVGPRAESSPRLVLKKVVPLVEDAPLDYVEMARSA